MRATPFLIVLGILATASPAWADLQDVAWSPQGKTGQLLLKFSDQPVSAKVMVHSGYVDVDVQGVTETAGEVKPAGHSDILGVQMIPSDGGARFRIRLDALPDAADVKVYRNSVLLTAHFPQNLQSVQARPQKPTYVKTNPKAQPKPAHMAPVTNQPEAHAVPVQAENHAGDSHSDAMMAKEMPVAEEAARPEVPLGRRGVVVPKTDLGHDGDPALPKIELPKHGVGMIRDASTAMANGLSEAQCSASEKKVMDDPWALDNLSLYGACLAREGKMADARDVFERLITFDPETVSAYLGLGAIAQDAGQLDKAKAYYEEALALGGSDAQAAKVRHMLSALQTELDHQVEDAGHVQRAADPYHVSERDDAAYEDAPMSDASHSGH